MRTACVPQSKGTPRIAALLAARSWENGTPMKLGGAAKMAGSSVEVLGGMRSLRRLPRSPDSPSLRSSRQGSPRQPRAMDHALAVQRVDAAGDDDGGADPGQGVRQRREDEIADQCRPHHLAVGEG